MILITPKKCSQKQNKSKSDIANWKKIHSDIFIEKQQMTTQHQQKVKKNNEELLQKTQRIKQKTLPYHLKNPRVCILFNYQTMSLVTSVQKGY